MAKWLVWQTVLSQKSSYGKQAYGKMTMANWHMANQCSAAKGHIPPQKCLLNGTFMLKLSNSLFSLYLYYIFIIIRMKIQNETLDLGQQVTEKCFKYFQMFITLVVQNII